MKMSKDDFRIIETERDVFYVKKRCIEKKTVVTFFGRRFSRITSWGTVDWKGRIRGEHAYGEMWTPISFSKKQDALCFIRTLIDNNNNYPKYHEVDL